MALAVPACFRLCYSHEAHRTVPPSNKGIELVPRTHAHKCLHAAPYLGGPKIGMLDPMHSDALFRPGFW